MTALLVWWLAIQIVGLSVLPLSRAIFRWLPDEGYAFTKPLGLLLGSYALWMGASLGVLHNTRTAIALVVVVMAALCWVGLRRGDWRTWWHQHWRMVVTVEAVFAVSLIAIALLRAFDPQIAMTEKPMEFGFLNSILRSERFPPADPWMSGQSISYYYFGYVMVAFLTKLSGLASSYTFNLSTAMLCAMTAVGALGLVYNLVQMSTRRESAANRADGLQYGLLAAVLVCVLGNLEGIVELLNYNGWLPSGVVAWLGVGDLPMGGSSPGLVPADWMWWWRASRVIGTFDPASGQSLDYTINEFPFFSFLLGDVHPHVLALPFALLALALSLNTLAGGAAATLRDYVRRQWLSMVVLVLVSGGIAFLNTWDLPTYALVLAIAFAVGTYWQRRSFTRMDLARVIGFALTVVVGGVIAYFPFYLTLGSQAKGLGIVLVRSIPQQFFIFWGPFITLVALFLVAELVRALELRGWSNVRLGFSVWWALVPLAVALVLVQAAVLAALGLCLVAGVVLWLRYVRRAEMPTDTAATVAVARVGIGATNTLDGDLEFSTVEVRDPWRPMPQEAGMAPLEHRAETRPIECGIVFAVLLILVSLALLAGSEVVYLADLFGNRMNTVFKVYYQAWTMLGIGSAYVLYYLGRQVARRAVPRMSRTIANAAVVVFVILAALSMYYPLASAVAKSDGFARAVEFDGLAYLRETQPLEYDAIQWLRDNVPGQPAILEATGTSYSEYARVSAITGFPTVLGWDFHEQQWRGTYDEAGRRKADVEMIYRTQDVSVAQRLLDAYGVTYVYVGALERQAYGNAGSKALEKFSSFMDVAYQNASVTIYRERSAVGPA